MSSEPTPRDRLRALMDADPLDIADSNSTAAAPDDDRISAALEGADLDILSVEAQELLLELTASSASLEPTARGRLVDAAARALHKRRADASPLPRLLFLARRSAEETIEAVSTHVSVDVDTLLSVERGQQSIKELGPDAVATWVQHFDISREQARESIAKALRFQSASERAAASASTDAGTEDSEFLRAVMSRLEAPDDDTR